MVPDPTGPKHTFDLQLIRDRLSFDPSVFFDPTRCDFFDPSGKIEKFDIIRGNFPNSNPNHKWRPDLTRNTKFFTLTNHYFKPWKMLVGTSGFQQFRV